MNDQQATWIVSFAIFAWIITNITWATTLYNIIQELP